MQNKIKYDIITKYPLSNPYQKQRLNKIVIDITMSNKGGDKSPIPLVHSLTYLTGQYPTLKIAKNSVASFKLRKGSIIGALSTLRKNKLDNFLKLLTLVSLPHLAATIPGEELLANRNNTNSIAVAKKNNSTSLSLGIKNIMSILDPIFQQQVYAPFKEYSGGINIQFISSPNTNKHQIKFILSYNLIPIAQS